MPRRLLPALLVLLVAVGSTGCSDDGPGAEAPVDPDDVFDDCSPYEADPGVARLFCDGTATVRFTIDDATGEIRGGTCTERDGYAIVNAGVIAWPDREGEPPPSAGLASPIPIEGSGNDEREATGTIYWEGEGHLLLEMDVERDDEGGTLTARDFEHREISASWTC